MTSGPCSDSARALERVGHVLEAIRKLRRLLDGLSKDRLMADDDKLAACERYFEIISEASRHIPEAWKEQFGSEIPWRQVATIGNIIRHVYRNVDVGILWSIYENDLDPLQHALEMMIQVHGSVSP